MLQDIMALESLLGETARDLMKRASIVLGFNLMQKISETWRSGEQEPEWVFDQRICQPAIFMSGVLGIERLRFEDPSLLNSATSMAGFSVGEYTALYAAGALEFEDALRLVSARSAAITKCRPGCMISVLGHNRETIEKIQATAMDQRPFFIANMLFEDGFTVGCHQHQGEEVSECFKRQAGGAKKGVIRSVIIGSHYAFHTPLMADALKDYSPVLEEVLSRVRPPSCPVWLSSMGMHFSSLGISDAATLKAALEKHLCGGISWFDVINGIITAGVMDFLEIGASSQLKAMMRRINEGAFKRTKFRKT